MSLGSLQAHQEVLSSAISLKEEGRETSILFYVLAAELLSEEAK